MAVLAILILAGLGFAFWRAALAAYRRMVATAKTGGVTSSNCFFVGNDFTYLPATNDDEPLQQIIPIANFLDGLCWQWKL